jgi:hypothetical protein
MITVAPFRASILKVYIPTPTRRASSPSFKFALLLWPSAICNTSEG